MQLETSALAVGFAVTVLCTAIFADSVQISSCEITDEEFTRILELRFQDFDQNPDDGWRPYYASECYERAAQLLTAYISRYPDRVDKNYILPFHAGQMFALNNEYEKAKHFMRQGYSQRDSEIIDWNAFVDANIAFLQKDREMLLRMRERIAEQTVMTKAMDAPEWAIGKVTVHSRT